MSGDKRPSRLLGAKVAAVRAIGALSRLSGRGGGTTLPGRALLRMAPDAIERLAGRLEGGSAVVSATNGKTTTAGMIAAMIGREGRSLVHNKAGSNMAWGVATALVDGDGEEGLFEVDEAWLPEVCEAVRPRVLVLGNLFRDQLDRYGELERLADEWAELVGTLEGDCRFVLNADDPLVADLGRDGERRREGVTYFGIDDRRHALEELQHAHDAKHCRRCGAPYVYDYALVGHLGTYACERCGNARPKPDLVATRIELDGIRGSELEVSGAGYEPARLNLPVPGLYNVYNALAALAAARDLDVRPQTAIDALAGIEAVFGRVETIEVGGTPVSILLIKNPAGANEVLRTIVLEGDGGPSLDVWIALNDRIADGRDVSWIWDADFEILAPHLRRITCTGTRAAEIAVRLKYAGVPERRIELVDGLSHSLEAARKAAPGALFALPTYTALLELRTWLAREGHAEDYWR